MFPWTLVIAAVLLYCLYWYWSKPANLPPGPFAWPVFGNALSFLEPGKASLTVEQWTKQYGPILRVYIGDILIIILGDYKSVHEALVKQNDTFNGRPVFKSFLPKGVPHSHGIVMSDGERWKEQRRFALTTLRDFGFGRPILEPNIANEVQYVLKNLATTDGCPNDLRKLFNNAVSNVICSMVFSRRFDYDSGSFLNTVEKINYRTSESQMEFLSPFVLCQNVARAVTILPSVKKFKAEGEEMGDYVSQLMDETMATYDENKQPSNFIHAFMKASANSSGQYFYREQLMATVLDLFMAGTDTTAATLRWGLMHMAKNPTIQDRVYKELASVVDGDRLPQMSDRANLPYTEATLMEIQRLANLAPMGMAHRTVVDAKICGYDIPANTMVIPFLWNLMRDPGQYPDPETFDPSRFLDDDGAPRKDPSFIPFSAGKRICLGEALAKMEIFMFFTAMIMKFRFEFPPDAPDVKRFMGFTSTPEPFMIRAISREKFSS